MRIVRYTHESLLLSKGSQVLLLLAQRFKKIPRSFSIFIIYTSILYSYTNSSFYAETWRYT